MKPVLKLTALVLAMSLAGTAGAATTTPETVGNVTLFGAVTSFSPDWQWAVYDYPNSENLDLDPTNAITVNSMDEYDLNGSWYVAVEGYLPNTAPAGMTTSAGAWTITDSVSLSTLDGNVSFSTANDGSTLITIPVEVDNGGAKVTGKMTLSGWNARLASRLYASNGSSLRGQVFANGGVSTNYATGSSCFIPSGDGATLAFTSGLLIKDGIPQFESVSPESARLAYDTAVVLLNKAWDESTTKTRFELLGNYETQAWVDANLTESSNCAQGTALVNDKLSAMRQMQSYGAANVLALKPEGITVPMGTNGKWSATLTVTAAQL